MPILDDALQAYDNTELPIFQRLPENPYLSREISFPTFQKQQTQPVERDPIPYEAAIDQLHRQGEQDRSWYSQRLSDMEKYYLGLIGGRMDKAQMNGQVQAQVQPQAQAQGQAQPTGSTGIGYLDKMVELAPQLAYSLAKRGFGSYTDCSNFVARALIAAGINVNKYMNTASMANDLKKVGFTRMAYDPKALQPGDILWRNGHTETYLGNGKIIGAHNSKDGVGVRNLYNDFTHIFRKI